MSPTTGAAAVAPYPAWSITHTTTYWGSAVGPKPTNQAVGSLPSSLSAGTGLAGHPAGEGAEPRHSVGGTRWILDHAGESGEHRARWRGAD